MEYYINIGRYSDISPFVEDLQNDNYVIIRFRKRMIIDYFDLEKEDYLILKNYFDIAQNDGYQNKVINNLIIEKFDKVSIRLAINLIKNK